MRGDSLVADAAHLSHGPDGRLTDRRAAATIVFTVHNRRELLLEAIGYALRQTLPLHIIVADDASTDGVSAALAAAYPEITYLRSDTAKGPCFQRNRGLERAATPIVFPLDDDSLLVDPATLEKALEAFTDPKVAVAAIPFRNILQSPKVHQAFDPEDRLDRFDFVACAHGVRRDAVTAAGGYNEALFYMGEESDLAIRLVDHGWRAVVADAPAIDHMQPPNRKNFKPDYYGRRNDLLFVYQRVPARHLPAALARCVARGIRFSASTGGIKPMLTGYRDAVREILAGIERRSVSSATYLAYRASLNMRARKRRSMSAR